jgi:hypothetical protein
VKFRHPNGTVVNASSIAVEEKGSKVVVEPPAEEGHLAFTASTVPKDFRSPVFAEGSTEVILPRGMRVHVPLFATISPGGHETFAEDGRVHVLWEETPSSGLYVRYYLERDFYIYTGIVVGLLALGAVGVVYFRLKIRRIERERHEAGLEMEE